MIHALPGLSPARIGTRFERRPSPSAITATGARRFAFAPGSIIIRFVCQNRRRSFAMLSERRCRITDGGLDANWMVRHGIPTITFGAGQNNPHTVEEFVDLSEFQAGCRFALACATLD